MSHDGEGPLSDEVSQRKLKRMERKRARLRDADVRAVLSTPEGRRFVWRLIDDVCGTFSPSMTGNSQTFFNEGRRSVGIALMTETQRVDTSNYVHMLQEHLSRQQEEAAAKQSAAFDVERDE